MDLSTAFYDRTRNCTLKITYIMNKQLQTLINRWKKEAERLNRAYLDHGLSESEHGELSRLRICIKDLSLLLIDESVVAPEARMIIEICEKFYNIPYEKLLGRSRELDITSCRHVAMYLIKKYCKYPYKKVGMLFNRDHTTVIHAMRRVENSLFTTQDLYQDILDIEAVISGWAEAA